MKNFIKLNLIALLRVICAVFLTVGGYFSEGFGNYLSLGLFLLSYVILCYDVLIGAIKEIIKDKSLGPKMIMVLSSLGAIIMGEYAEGNIILILFVIGEIFTKTISDFSKKYIEVLSGLQTDRVRLKSGNVIPAKDVKENEVIEVYSGERIDVDGMVVGGVSTVDTSIITGRKTLKTVKHGSKVLAGYLNKEATISIKVSRPLSKSIAQRIVDITENSFEKKTKTESLALKFVRVYTLVSIMVAILIAIVPPVIDIITPVFGEEGFTYWVYKALGFLVISCPCSILISVPLAYFRGFRYASYKGILIKGSSAVEALRNTEIIAFDKTGTLTRSELVVTSVDTYGENVDRVKLLTLVAIVEKESKHPVAAAIKSLVEKLNIEVPNGENYVEIAESGVECDSIYGHIKAGGKTFVDSPNGITASVYVSLDGKYVGSIGIGDQLKYNSVRVFEKLRKLGIKKKVILSGDKKFKTDKIAKMLVAEMAYSNIKPVDKVHAIEDIKTNNPDMKVAYCGNGVNDISALQCADIGISIGAIDKEEAVNASEVVIIDENLENVVRAFKIAKKTHNASRFNIVISAILKIVVGTLFILPFFHLNLTCIALVNLGILIFTVINSMLAGR